MRKKNMVGQCMIVDCFFRESGSSAPLACCQRTLPSAKMHSICTNLAMGVVMVVGADAGVGWPKAVVAVAVTSYVVPGARPVRTQS